MRIVFLLMILGIALVFYLSWVPSPKMELVWFLPDWVARWADVKENENIRTAVPFVFLGVLMGVLLVRVRKPWPWWFVSLLGLTAVALIAEVGQLTLSHRYFSWSDVLWGTAGSALGLLIASGFRWMMSSSER
ncbi:hypothetical protein GCM10028803_08060 [Larkinella knui]|uniref:VanZ family protein n=1 Tax=Larkinella knui TaxID=2025310 RepID=A0A3P1CK06_9BACT|nr:VanZ family protein [Larkinella knui]RRB13530.1 VanZ family protein [Larkinella knui]